MPSSPCGECGRFAFPVPTTCYWCATPRDPERVRQGIREPGRVKDLTWDQLVTAKRRGKHGLKRLLKERAGK
jgi:uncharacterized OB-fold protein